MKNIVLLTILMLFAACSSSDDANHSIIYDDNFVFAELTDGAVSIPRYSDGRLFLLLYNIPSVKNETVAGNSVGEELGSLTVAGVPPLSSIPDIPQATDAAFKNDRNYDNIHDRMRLVERELLASGLRQYGDVKGRNAKLIAPKIFNVGDPWEWYVSMRVGYNYEPVATKCKGISAHAYFFVDNGINVPAEYLEALKAEFDSKYDLMHEYFGEENDVDGNGKVVIIITELAGNVAGYFLANDKFPKTDAPYSNEADVFYINSRYILNEAQQPDAFEYMVHEFQHMIYFDNAYRRGYVEDASATWLNEALSMLAIYLCGYSRDVLDSYIWNFLNFDYRYLSMTGWTSDNYGYGSMFGRHLYERFGADVIKRIYSAGTEGYRAVEIATGMDFNELFKDFVIACAISGKGVLNDKKYNFDTIDFSLYSGPDDANLRWWLMDAGMQRSFGMKPYSFVLLEIFGTADRVVSDNFSGVVFRIKP